MKRMPETPPGTPDARRAPLKPLRMLAPYVARYRGMVLLALVALLESERDLSNEKLADLEATLSETEKARLLEVAELGEFLTLQPLADRTNGIDPGQATTGRFAHDVFGDRSVVVDR